MFLIKFGNRVLAKRGKFIQITGGWNFSAHNHCAPDAKRLKHAGERLAKFGPRHAGQYC